MKYKIGIGYTTTSSRFDNLDYFLTVLLKIIDESINDYDFKISIACDGELKDESLKNWNFLKDKYKNFIFQCKNNQSIAKTKNLSLMPLKENECDFYLMMDDDCFINDKRAIDYYLKACEEFHFLHLHLTGWLKNRGDDSPRLIKKFDNFSIKKFNYPNGCFLIFDKLVLEKTGGWNNDFIGWGFEHGEFERRTQKILNLKEIYLAIPEVYENDYIISLDALFNNNCNKQYPFLDKNLKLNDSKVEYIRSSCYEHNKEVNQKSMDQFK